MISERATRSLPPCAKCCRKLPPKLTTLPGMLTAGNAALERLSGPCGSVEHGACLRKRLAGTILPAGPRGAAVCDCRGRLGGASSWRDISTSFQQNGMELRLREKNGKAATPKGGCCGTKYRKNKKATCPPARASGLLTCTRRGGLIPNPCPSRIQNCLGCGTTSFLSNPVPAIRTASVLGQPR